MELPKDDGRQSIAVKGARVHNLRNIDVLIPKQRFVVITGLSGSGKSSLAFDTIYAEGQRRYIESFSSYARHFIGKLERPDVDYIRGITPVISIEQKTVNKNPRSTVGTITEIYDFLRVLFARASDAYSINTGERMVRYSDEQIIHSVLSDYYGKWIWILSPVVKGRKGHYKDLFEQIRKKGFIRVRVDGEVRLLVGPLQLDRYKLHNIEVIIDRIKAHRDNVKRLHSSISEAINLGKGILMIMDQETGETKYFSRRLMCPSTGISYDDPAPNLFSFNSPYGACNACNGLGEVSEIDMKKIIPDINKSIKQGGIVPLGTDQGSWTFKQIDAVLSAYASTLDTPINAVPDEAMKTILYGSDKLFRMNKDLTGINAIRNFTFEGIINILLRQNNAHPSPSFKKWLDGFMNRKTCPVCQGSRLKKEALHFKIAGKHIAQLASMDVCTLQECLHDIERKMNKKQAIIAKEPLKEIRSRLRFLSNVGLSYLSLNRSAASLSGGESQRIRLATQIGSRLVGVTYILDEPSIGLHQSDNRRLIETLKQLRDTGNSVIVVEHDKEIIKAADHVIDLGPGAGKHGGKVVSEGAPHCLKSKHSLTAQYLTAKREISLPEKRRKGNGKYLELTGASGYNLKHINVRFPLASFICITGVSGSGKSTLINNTLYPALAKCYHRLQQRPLPFKKITGTEHLDKVIEITQAPIGRTPRSNTATYTGVFSDIRMLFAQVPQAMIMGYKPGRFSFNVKGGRCETCQGAGVRTIEMNFLPNVYVHCESCHGKRYNRETLEVKYKNKSIDEVLNMTVNQALDFFNHIPGILRKINMLKEVGLGYLTLAQSSTTLSGGEAQRLKLASELAKRDTGNTLYILDEPTTGLHFEDCDMLLSVLNKLVDRGNTVLVIEHNMDIIKMADYVIDLGPGGGDAGGYIIAEGSPEEIVNIPESLTGSFLKNELFR